MATAPPLSLDGVVDRDALAARCGMLRTCAIRFWLLNVAGKFWAYRSTLMLLSRNAAILFVLRRHEGGPRQLLAMNSNLQ